MSYKKLILLWRKNVCITLFILPCQIYTYIFKCIHLYNIIKYSKIATQKGSQTVFIHTIRFVVCSKSLPKHNVNIYFYLSPSGLCSPAVAMSLSLLSLVRRYIFLRNFYRILILLCMRTSWILKWEIFQKSTHVVRTSA